MITFNASATCAAGRQRLVYPKVLTARFANEHAARVPNLHKTMCSVLISTRSGQCGIKVRRQNAKGPSVRIFLQNLAIVEQHHRIICVQVTRHGGDEHWQKDTFFQRFQCVPVLVFVFRKTVSHLFVPRRHPFPHETLRCWTLVQRQFVCGNARF